MVSSHRLGRRGSTCAPRVSHTLAARGFTLHRVAPSSGGKPSRRSRIKSCDGERNLGSQRVRTICVRCEDHTPQLAQLAELNAAQVRLSGDVLDVKDGSTQSKPLGSQVSPRRAHASRWLERCCLSAAAVVSSSAILRRPDSDLTSVSTSPPEWRCGHSVPLWDPSGDSRRVPLHFRDEGLIEESVARGTTAPFGFLVSVLVSSASPGAQRRRGHRPRGLHAVRGLRGPALSTRRATRGAVCEGCRRCGGRAPRRSPVSDAGPSRAVPGRDSRDAKTVPWRAYLGDGFAYGRRANVAFRLDGRRGHSRHCKHTPNP